MEDTFLKKLRKKLQKRLDKNFNKCTKFWNKFDKIKKRNLMEKNERNLKNKKNKKISGAGSASKDEYFGM